MSPFEKAVQTRLGGYKLFTVGHREGCEDCEHFDPDAGDEGHFAWSECESCGSKLGGMRYVGHGYDPGVPGERACGWHHFSICADCQIYHETGEVPDGSVET